MAKKTCNCYGCGTEFTMENGVTLERSDLKDIFSLRAFVRNCPKCKKETLFYLPAMYQDMEGSGGTFIWMNPQPRDAAQGLVDHFHSMGMRGGVHRVVGSPYEFAEKLMVFERGFDDRSMEIVKLLMVMRVMKEQPSFKVDSAHFMMGKNGGEDHFLIYDQDGERTSMPFIESMYELTQDHYEGYYARTYKDNAMRIDLDWAIRFYGEKHD